MRHPAVLLGVAATLAVSAAGAPAQERTCDLREYATLDVQNRDTPAEVAFIRGPRFVCGPTQRLSADSATWSAASGQITMFDRVRFDDTDRTLTASFAQYFTRTRHLLARDAVVLRDTRTGSVITSDMLNYYEVTATRPQSLVVATRLTGPLARAILFDDRPAAEGARPDSMVVDAQEIQIIGEESFRGIGSATLTRDSLRATGHQIEYYEQIGRLDVLGAGYVTLPGYELRGDSITATLDDEREIRDVLTRHGASLVSEEMQVTSPAIRLLFENGGIARLVAMNWQPAQNAQPGARPRAVSEQFRMESDSIDVLSPEQQVREAVAVGNAHVERIMPDSLRALLPEADPEVMALIGNDWVRGDTVRALFAAGAEPSAAGGDAPAERVLERLTATGGPAQALHLMGQENAEPDTRLSIAYLIGRMVEVTFADGVVADVQASADVRGVYLQPQAAARALGAQPADRRRR
jgi:hypothetical protein